MSEAVFVRVYRNLLSEDPGYDPGIPIVDIQLVMLSTEFYTCLACGTRAPVPGICVQCKGQHMLCAKLHKQGTVSNLTKYLQLKKSLQKFRDMNGNAESKEEDDVLDEMERIWHTLTDVEKAVV